VGISPSVADLSPRLAGDVEKQWHFELEQSNVELHHQTPPTIPAALL